MIVIVDYGVGNLASIQKFFKKSRIDAKVGRKPRDVAEADKLILPGVGAFGEGMRKLVASGLLDELNRKVLEDETPVLGICLGMQMLGGSSEEGEAQGLGWIAGRSVRFNFPPEIDQLRVPHVGWNDVELGDCPLLEGLPSPASFYFTHSYHLQCDDPATVKGWAEYGLRFAAVVQQGNIYGTQFHPEKSHEAGRAVLKNFVERCR